MCYTCLQNTLALQTDPKNTDYILKLATMLTRGQSQQYSSLSKAQTDWNLPQTSLAEEETGWRSRLSAGESEHNANTKKAFVSIMSSCGSKL